MNQLPIPRATLEEMERNRARAIVLYGEAFDTLQEARRFAQLATISGKTSDGDGALGGAEFSDDARNAIAPRYVFERDSVDKRRAEFVEAMTKQTDRAMWGHIIRATDLEKLMDKRARDEFRDELQKAPPPALAENVRATLSAFMEDAETIFRRGIAVAFSELDRRFKSHDGFKVGSRVILSYAFSTGSFSHWNGRREETLRDIERTFCVLDGDKVPDYGASIVAMCSGMRGDQWEVEGAYFRVRKFKNGNAHLWFTRPDLVRRVNRLLADYYGEAIGEGADVADVSHMGPGYHITPARNFGLFESPADVVATVFERLGGVKEGERILEPSAGRGRLADEARQRGGDVHCVEIQPELCTTLRGKGHKVTQGDFLQMTPGDLGLFDIVVMNPPFDRGRDCDHVRHALQFLKPGGRLVSVMAAGVEFREGKRAEAFRALVMKQKPISHWDRNWTEWRGPYQDLPAGSFKESGTMVNTLTLALRTPE